MAVSTEVDLPLWPCLLWISTGGIQYGQLAVWAGAEVWVLGLVGARSRFGVDCAGRFLLAGWVEQPMNLI